MAERSASLAPCGRAENREPPVRAPRRIDFSDIPAASDERLRAIRRRARARSVHHAVVWVVVSVDSPASSGAKLSLGGADGLHELLGLISPQQGTP
jgi:hypothetical protein